MNTVIHAAVRRDLDRFGHALDTLPVGSRKRAAELDAAWRHLDAQLYHHHHGEETIFWPALRELGPTSPWSEISAASTNGWPKP